MEALRDAFRPSGVGSGFLITENALPSCPES
jgi:hypothetical protein